MPETVPAPAPSLLDGYLDKAALAAALNYKSERSIDRMMNQPDGLPFIVVNRKPYFHVERVRAWLEAHERQKNKTRRSARS